MKIVLSTIQSRRLQWAGHACHSQKSEPTIVHGNGGESKGEKTSWTVEMDRRGKERLGISKYGGSDWKERAADRENWRIGCLMEWS